MWKSVLDEAREVVWLASLVGGLSAVGVGIAFAREACARGGAQNDVRLQTDWDGRGGEV